jgi:ATP-dependent helicase Lhr and Lhr-like helicase
MSPPLFSILHGRQELGYVDEMTFLGKHEGPRVLLLGGRSWKVNHIDWQRRIAHVEATDVTGRSRWKGQGQGLGFRLAQAIKRILATDQRCRVAGPGEPRSGWARSAKSFPGWT